jgi:phage terminase large subunit
MAYDPADTGDDKAICHMHGSVVLDVISTDDGDVSQATTWACKKAAAARVDAFIWDLGGMGTGLKYQIEQHLGGKSITLFGFNGASKVEYPGAIAEKTEENIKGSKTNEQSYLNLRCQKYSELMWRVYRTFEAVTSNKHYSPEDMISFSSECQDLAVLRSELCRIPRVYNSGEKFQVMSKPKMKEIGLGSPNAADVVMMALSKIDVKKSMQAPRISAAPQPRSRW